MNNYIEIDADDVLLDFEKQMLAEVNIPSLLPVNIINQNDKSAVCFITTGYKTIEETEINNIETLCNIVKSFVRAIIKSEQYLLMGGKHFIDTDMVFYDKETKETRLIFGEIKEKDHHFGDTGVVVEFINNLKSKMTDRVHLQILAQIITQITRKNTDIKRITVQIEEIERKWYCRNLIPEFAFSKRKDKVSNGLN